MNSKQLIINPDNPKEIYPKQFMGNVLDDETNENLYSYLSKFNHINVGDISSPKDAYNSIPNIYRKNGFFITYTFEGESYTEYFAGNNNDIESNWDNLDYWKAVDGVVKVASHSISLQQLSKEVLDLIGSNPNIKIVNYPDGEDLSQFDVCAGKSKYQIHALQFSDKKYNDENFTGLGRKYLRKNIVDGKNILTQELISESNTRYIIQYDYDLNEDTIEVPENCILDFQGGSFTNGYIIYNEKTIDGSNIGNIICYFSKEYNKPVWWNGSEWITWNDSQTSLAYKSSFVSSDSENKIVLNLYKKDDSYYLIDNNKNVEYDISDDLNLDLDSALSILEIDDTSLNDVEKIVLIINDDESYTRIISDVDVVATNEYVELSSKKLTIKFMNDSNIVEFTFSL